MAVLLMMAVIAGQFPQEWSVPQPESSGWIMESEQGKGNGSNLCSGLQSATFTPRPSPRIAFQASAIDERRENRPPELIPPANAYGLDRVQDVTPLSFEDGEAYYGLLHLARQVSQADLHQAGRAFIQQRRQASGEPTFPDMLHHPQAWRGQPVVLEGHILQTLEYPAEKNSYGITTLYESSLFTDDSEHHPITVVFLDKPDNLPLGGEVVGSVAVTGYFLKMYVYPSSDKKSRVAPLILAKTITVFPPPQHGPIVPAAVQYGILAGLVVLGIIAAWWSLKSDRRRRDRQKKEIESEHPDFGALP